MKRAALGFTLVELIVSIVIASVLLAFMTVFVTGPVDMYFAQTRRAELADSSDAGWKQLDEEIRGAVPNSLRRSRNGSFEALELLRAIDVGRYQNLPGNADARDLEIGTSDGTFTTAGRFGTVGAGLDTNVMFLVINNSIATNAYNGVNVITPNPTRIQLVDSATLPGELDVTLTPAPTFLTDSPQRRMFLVTGAVSYLCDEAAGTLTRYTGYGINPAQINTSAGFAGATATPIVRNLSTCNFTVAPGTATHGEVVTLRLTFARAGDPSGERMTVMRQSHVEYLP
jgi:MSHA biogenesis protein MshO